MACCDEILDLQKKIKCMNYPIQASAYFNISKMGDVYYKIEFKNDNDKIFIIWNLNNTHLQGINLLLKIVETLIPILRKLLLNFKCNNLKTIDEFEIVNECLNQILKNYNLFHNIQKNENNYENVNIINYRSKKKFIVCKKQDLNTDVNILSEIYKDKIVIDNNFKILFDGRKSINFRQSINLMYYKLKKLFEQNENKLMDLKNILKLLIIILKCCYIYKICYIIHNNYSKTGKVFLSEVTKIKLYETFKNLL